MCLMNQALTARKLKLISHDEVSDRASDFADGTNVCVCVSQMSRVATARKCNYQKFGVSWIADGKDEAINHF